MNNRREWSTGRPNRECHAWTLVELLVIVALGCLLAALFQPMRLGGKSVSQRINCVSNLKNVGLAFRAFATDHQDLFPMSLSVTNGGTREWVDDPAKVWLHYFVMSNHVATPGLLVCPADKAGRLKATCFATNLASAASKRWSDKDKHVPFSSNRNLSYFVGLGADETRPAMLLAGDRNLTNGEPVRFEYGQARVGNLGTNHPSRAGQPGAGWDRRMHDGAGNVCLSDGSVQQCSSARLRDALRNSGDTENRIATPD